MKYSETLLKHFYHPQNVGVYDPLVSNIGSAKVGSYENGVLIQFQVEVEKDRIISAKFKAYGSCPVIAACSYATEWIKHKTFEDAMTISTILMRDLEIPDIKIHCALLVQEALQKAIEDYRINGKDL